jgi:hypothetical protein
MEKVETFHNNDAGKTRDKIGALHFGATPRQEKAPLPEIGVEAGQGAITPPFGGGGATKPSHVAAGGEIKTVSEKRCCADWEYAAYR